MSLAARRLGLQHVGLIESNARCIETLRANGFSDLVHEGLTEVDFTAYRGVTVIIGGPPCQPWSIGGLSKGEYDERNLWMEMVRAVKEAKPQLFMFEMVSGFTRPKFAPFVDLVLAQLRDAGYHTDIEQVDAKDYGTPQRRSRCLVLGRRHGGRIVRPERRPVVTVRDAIASLGPPADGSANRHEERGIASHYVGHRPSQLDNVANTVVAGNHGPGGGNNTVQLDDGTVRYFTIQR